MAVDYKKLKVGDKVRYLGGYIPEHYGGLTIGKEYDVIGIDNRDLAHIANDKGYGRFIGYYNAHCFELVESIVDYGRLRKGDKLRYLGGDDAEENGDLLVGEVYEVLCEEEAADEMFLISEKYKVWFIDEHNAKHFEIADNKSPTSYNHACKHDSHIVSLAKEVAELKRELSELKEYVEKEAVLFDERLIEVESKKPSADKAQYVTVYGSEYIDKLFGGDSE